MFEDETEIRDFSLDQNLKFDLKVDFGSKTGNPTKFADLHGKIAKTNHKILNDSEMLKFRATNAWFQ